MSTSVVSAPIGDYEYMPASRAAELVLDITQMAEQLTQDVDRKQGSVLIHEICEIRRALHALEFELLDGTHANGGDAG